ncbi:MAG: hypothetical protein Q4F13_01445 [Pseudomonadota bacterium]|nr:hypothetical protein [Pseudomonadota bacterium]
MTPQGVFVSSLRLTRGWWLLLLGALVHVSRHHEDYLSPQALWSLCLLAAVLAWLVHVQLRIFRQYRANPLGRQVIGVTDGLLHIETVPNDPQPLRVDPARIKSLLIYRLAGERVLRVLQHGKAPLLVTVAWPPALECLAVRYFQTHWAQHFPSTAEGAPSLWARIWGSGA